MHLLPDIFLSIILWSCGGAHWEGLHRACNLVAAAQREPVDALEQSREAMPADLALSHGEGLKWQDEVSQQEKGHQPHATNPVSTSPSR